MSLASKTLQSIANKSILITGGASGLGEATARYLTEQGAKVTIIDMNAEKGKEIAAEIKGQYVQANVADEADVMKAIAAAHSAHGPLFGAVNCAGIAPAAKILGKKGPHPLDTYAKAIQVNLIGTFNVSRLAAEAMAKNKENIPATEDCGVIINTASVAAYDGQIGQTAYASSKGGVVALTLPMARELAEHRIRVNTICPGIIRTPMLAGLPQPAQDSLGRSVPYPPRLGEPSEYAALVHFLMMHRYMNGESIRMDGSLRMAPK